MPRRTSLWLALIAVALLPAPILRAQAPEQPGKEVENSRYMTTGLVSSNAVFVRCGPGENYYPTMKLDKGAKITVVGEKFDWLKIEPPAGSFCYVAKLYVDRHGDGKVGRVNKDSINVRAGSTLSALKIGILCELRQNEEVTILGEEQEYFKIAPPKGAYLFVNKKFVEPDPEGKLQPQISRNESPKPEVKPETTRPEVKPEAVKNENPAQAENVTANDAANNTGNAAASKTNENMTGGTTDTTPATRPSTVENTATPGTTARNTVPVEPIKPEDAEAQFDKAEAQYVACRKMNLEDHPVAEMLRQYESLAKNDALPESMRRLCDARVEQLKVRLNAQAELKQLRQARGDEERKRLALKAEQEELEQRIKENAVAVYTAVGALQPSSLQVGSGPTLYRVTDPSTGKTLCYLRSNDVKLVSMLNQFVGIKGTMQDEARLGAKVILPTDVVPCDPSKVYVSVTAQIIPPSLMPRQASTDPNP